MKSFRVAWSMWSTCVPSMRRNSDERHSPAGGISDTNIAMCVAPRGIFCCVSVALCVKKKSYPPNHR